MATRARRRRCAAGRAFGDDGRYAVEAVPEVPRLGFLVFRRSSPCPALTGTVPGMLRLTTQGGARVMVGALASSEAGAAAGLLMVDDPDVPPHVNGAALVGDLVVSDHLPPAPPHAALLRLADALPSFWNCVPSSRLRLISIAAVSAHCSPDP